MQGPPGMSRGRAPGRRGMGRWSMTTWLIATCVAIFFVDASLKRVPVEMAHWYDDQHLLSLDTLDFDDNAPAPVYRGERIALRLKDVTRSIPGDPGEVPHLLRAEKGYQVTDADGAGPVLGYRRLFAKTSQGVMEVGHINLQFMHPMESALHFSTARGFLRVEFWRMIGFQFLHSHQTVWHLFLNMLALYFLGSLVEQALGSKRFLAFYLLCGICGALLYSLLNLGGFLLLPEVVAGEEPTSRIPFLLFHDPTIPLVGASAGVFGIIMAGAFLAPNAIVYVMFLIPMRLQVVAWIFLLLAVFTLLTGGDNAGGEAGHLGGAMAGFYFIRNQHHLHGFFDILGKVDPTSRHFIGGRARGRAVAKSRGTRTPQSRARIDAILDKIHATGLHSLTEKEKRILREASEQD